MWLSDGSPMARKAEAPAPVHCVRVGMLAPTTARVVFRFQGPARSTLSSALPVLVGTEVIVTLTPPLADVLGASTGLLMAARVAAVLKTIAPLSVGGVKPAGTPLITTSARLLTSCTVGAAQVATRWMAGRAAPAGAAVR